MYFFLIVLSDLIHQLPLRQGNTHDLIVSFRIHQVFIADDLNELAIVQLGDDHRIIALQDLTQIFGERTDITQMRMCNELALPCRHLSGFI